jgi:hypothetical protein
MRYLILINEGGVDSTSLAMRISIFEVGIIRGPVRIVGLIGVITE